MKKFERKDLEQGLLLIIAIALLYIAITWFI